MFDLRPHLMPKVRSQAIRNAASGVPCTIRISSMIPGHQCSDPSTCVMDHLPVDGKGKSTKVTDLAVGIGCSNCHAILDGVDIKKRDYLYEKYPAALADRLLRSIVMTHTILIEEGVIQIPDAKLILSGPWRP